MADERRKLSVVKRLRAQGLNEFEIKAHLDKMDQEAETQELAEGAQRRGDDIFKQLGKPVILGSDGKPMT